MNTYYRNLFTIFGISLALCIVTFLVFIRAERINRYKAVIPEKLKINGVVLQGEDNTPLIYVLLLPIRPFSCGGGVFKLSQSTIDASKSEGLDFFKDATQPRKRKYTYPAWQETPVPYTWTNDGAWSGLNCINKNTKLIRKITKASELPGSYYTYTNRDNYRIVVFPELSFVVFTFWD
ncbi:hypothetical protein [Myxosarcina sp. GI1(2024)]